MVKKRRKKGMHSATRGPIVEDRTDLRPSRGWEGLTACPGPGPLAVMDSWLLADLAEAETVEAQQNLADSA